jgi:hypothetical protein
MNEPVSAGKSISVVLNLLTSAMKLTPTNSSRILGVMLIVCSVVWLGENIVKQLEENNQFLIASIEDQTAAVIIAFKKNATENGIHAKNMRDIFDGIKGSNRDLEYLRGRMDEFERRLRPYKSASYKVDNE